LSVVKYVGNRPYVEFKHNGQTYGFSRGMVRDDIPEELAVRFEHSGYPQWEVTELKKTPSTKELLAVVEEVKPEPVKEVKIEEPAPSIVEELFESPIEEVNPFDPNWTRSQMMRWFREQGLGVERTDTKASLTARAASLGDEE
jgi:hypothetical protein